ncbi:MAG TPA: lysophospholipid acyltransferase family protein [Victivallales bacterium]|nr:lysophospholipid acyltransferase family protein [Victivallales bacterium]
MSKKKNTIAIYLEYFCFVFAEKALLALPAKIAYFFGQLAADTVFFLDLKHRHRAMAHLLHSGIVKNRAEARSMARKCFRHFGAVMIDIIRIPKEIHESGDLIKNISLSGSSKGIELFMTNGSARQAIVVTAHFGNWEIAGIGYCCLSGRDLLTVMRDFDNPLIGKVFMARRTGYGHKLVTKKGSLKSLIGAVRGGKSVCFIADQHAGGNDGIKLDFFGHPAKVHKSPALLHLKTGVPIFVAVCARTGPMKYEIRLRDPIMPEEGKDKSVEDVVRAYTSHLESLILENPEQWIWPHRRWLDINRKRR